MYRNVEEGIQDYHKAWTILKEIGDDPQEFDAGRMFAAVEAGHKSLYALHRFQPITAWLTNQAKPEWERHVEWVKRQYFTRWLPVTAPLNEELGNQITAKLHQLATGLMKAKKDKNLTEFKKLRKDADEIIFGVSCYSSPQNAEWVEGTIREWKKFLALLA